MNDAETRQERREKRLKKKRERMPKHGKNMARVYMDAILKRLRGKWDALYKIIVKYYQRTWFPKKMYVY